MAKRGLSLLLAVLSVLSLAVPAFAEEAPVTEEPEPTEEPATEPEVTDAPDAPEAEPETVAAYSGYCGNNVTWSLSGGTLTISGTGKMWDYNLDYTSPWYLYRDYIKNVVIKSGVTNIGEAAFNGCNSLVSIDIPTGVTNIGPGAFYQCFMLASVKMPNSVTSIGNSAFSDCQSLASLDLPDSVTSIGAGAFWQCGLKSLKIPDGVTKIENHTFMFSAIKSVTIPDSVTSIGLAAFDCSALQSVTIPDSVTSIGDNAFCMTGLTSVTIPSSVTSIGNGVFISCPLLKSITIPSSVTSIGHGALGFCDALTDVYYGGSKAQWNAIRFGDENESLWAATIHYNSAPKPQLAAPTVKIAKVSTGIKVSWNKIAGSPRYMVYYKEGNGGWKKIGTTTSTTYTRAAKYLKNNVTYTFTVRCCENDKKTLLGPYKASNALKYTAQLAAPTVKIAKVAGGIKVSWNKVTGSPRYMVYYKEGNGGWKKIGTTTSTTYTRAAKYLKNGVTYQFTVRCCENDKKTLLGPYKASNSLKYTK